MKRCDRCKFWIKVKEEDVPGDCRRHTPIPFIRTVTNPLTQQMGVIVNGYWFKTMPELWCGKYRGHSRFIRFYHLIARVLEFLFVHTKASIAKDATTVEQRREECLTKEEPKNILTDVSRTRKSSLN